MKTKRIFATSGIIILLSFILYAFTLRQSVKSESSDIKVVQGFPEEIMKILTNSCYDCHTSNSQNKAASFLMDFKKWDEYKDSKKAQLLIKIDQEVSEKGMPPKKYLEDNPCRALSDEQIKLVSKWAKEEAAKLNK
jgi:mono/diheme cytochrome c family protein